jgi:hypothetical protein
MKLNPTPIGVLVGFFENLFFVFLPLRTPPPLFLESLLLPTLFYIPTPTFFFFLGFFPYFFFVHRKAKTNFISCGIEDDNKIELKSFSSSCSSYVRTF